MSTKGYRQRDTTSIHLAGDSMMVDDHVYDAFRRQKEACRQRMDQKELTNAEFLQVLLDVHALHFDCGGGQP